MLCRCRYNHASMDLVTGAVAIVGLKHLGKPAAGVVADFLKRVLAPTGDALGGAIAHPIVEWQKRRVERAESIVEDAARAVHEAGAVPQPVPGRILMPLLERASLEEEDSLRAKWVQLLATAATPAAKAVLPAYVSILSELSPAEAAVLDWIYTKSKRTSDTGRIYFSEQLTSAVENALQMSEGEVELYVFNLCRLGLLRQSISLDSTWVEDVIEHREGWNPKHSDRTSYGRDLEVTRDDHKFEMTPLGGAFVEACSRSGQ